MCGCEIWSMTMLLMALPSTRTDGCLSAPTSVYARTSRGYSSWTSHDIPQTHFWTGQHRRCPLSSRVRHCAPHHATHWLHRKTATTSSKHSWGQPPPYGWRNYQSPAPRSPSTAASLSGDLDCTFQLPYSSKCSSPSMSCRTWAPKQWQSWSHSASYVRACGRIATPGHVRVSPARAPKSPVTR
jgi:hypothetical protein